MKKAIITGITGQDGSWLAEFLIGKGYEVHGLVRRASAGYGNLRNIIHLVQDENIYRKQLFLHAGDMADTASIYRIVKDVMPDEIYNLAAMADVQESNFMGEYSIDVNGTGVYRVLEAVRTFKPDCRVYQASTSELFGAVDETPQNENTRFNPQSPYSIGKLTGYEYMRHYRKAYDIFACNGILFNHESERRGDDYVTRKITRALARIKLGKQRHVRLGNLKAYRDWGYAKEYVEAMWKMLQMEKPDDYVIGTGEEHTVEEWLDTCLEIAGLDRDCVIIDKRLFRPAEVDILKADATKAKEVLGFEPKVKFRDLIDIMLNHDLENEKLSSS